MKTLILLTAILLTVGCGKDKHPKDETNKETPSKGARAKKLAEDKKSLPKDLPSLKELAEKGNANAQYELGWMYDEGKEVEQDDKEAVKWYRKSCRAGNS